jgi:hypothetical protein
MPVTNEEPPLGVAAEFPGKRESSSKGSIERTLP